MKILVTYAVQGEFTELKFPGMRGNDEVQVGYLRTGIGKVKSAYYLTDALNRLQPDLVINIGTAGRPSCGRHLCLSSFCRPRLAESTGIGRGLPSRCIRSTRRERLLPPLAGDGRGVQYR